MSVLSKIRNKNTVKGEIKATLCYLVSNIFNTAFGFITIPLYTGILTTSEYGYLNTYNAWVNLLSVVMGLSLSSAIYGKTKLERRDRDRFQSSIIALSLLVAGILTGIVLLAYVLIFGQIDILVVLALLQGYGAFAVNFVLQEFVVDNKYIAHSIVSVGMTAIPIGITCLIINLFFKNQRYLSVIIPRAVTIILLMFIFTIKTLARGKKLYDKDAWGWSLSYCIPIVFHSLSLMVMLQADRIMLSYLYGYEESGIYSFIYNVTIVIGVLVAALENTWKTWFFKNYDKADRKHIQSRCRLFITVALLGVCVYIFLAPDLVKIIAAEEYRKQLFLIGPIAFAYIISYFYDFLVYVEYKKEATKNIAKASIIAALVNIVLNTMIIPLFGGIGAACTTCIAYVVQFAVHILVVNRLDRGLYPFRLFIPYIIIGIVVVIVFLFSLNLAVVRYIIAAFTACIMLLLIYRKRKMLS